jgi:ABC-type uncharacterized transport system ATPase subunit
LTDLGVIQGGLEPVIPSWLRECVKKLKEETDMVIVSPHWCVW